MLQNQANPSCTDLVLINYCKYFQNSNVLETGLSDFYKIHVTVMKRCYKKLKPEIIRYRDYGYDSNERFKETVISELSKVVIENNDKSFNRFLSICRETLNTYTPLKKRYI